MMRGIIKTSVSFRYIVIILAGMILFVGISQIQEMPVDVIPEISPTYVEIQTEALGLSAEEVEQMITVPMEQDLLAGVAWLDVIHSESVPGLSSVLLYFEPGTDLYKARQMVAERLAQAAVGLPNVSKPPTMIQPLSSTSRFMLIGLSSEELSLIEISVLARWTIAPRLMGVPGVANVSIWGQRERQLQVLVDPELLRAQDVSLEQVVETTGNALWVSPLSFLEASSPGTGGFIDTPNQRLGVWHVLPISSPEDLAEVPVEDSDSLVIGDVADVVEDHQPLIGDAVINNSSTLLLVVEKLPGINTLKVSRDLEAALDALRPGMASIAFDATLFRPATFIEVAISNLSKALVLSALLAIFLLGALLYDWRTTLISLVAVFTSLVAALGVLYLRGETLNSMVLAGMIISLGIVIDEVVVDVVHMKTRLNQNAQQDQPRRVENVILESLYESRGSIIFGTLISLLVMLPVLYVLPDPTGAVFRPLALSYTIAVLSALLVALILTPALTIILYPESQRNEKVSPLILLLQRGYDRISHSLTQKPVLLMGAAAVLVVAGIVMIPFLRVDRTLPAFREPYLMINLEGAPATSRSEMNRIIGRIGAEIQSIPGVQNAGAHVGRAVFGDQVVGINSAQLWVRIDPQADYTETVSTIQEVVDGYPGIRLQVSSYLEQILNQSSTKTDNTITVRVFGEELEILRQQAENIRQSVVGIPGIGNASVDLPVEEPTVEIEVDLVKAQEYGIKPGDVRRAAAVMLSGLSVGSLFEEQKVFDVVVWGVPDIRENLTDIRELPLEVPGGGYVHLGDVADVRIQSSPTVIRREAVSPYLDVHLLVQGRESKNVLRDVEMAIKGLVFPLEYHAEVLSDYAEQQAANRKILLAIAIVLLGILLLLQASTSNWLLALAILITLPLSLVGGLAGVFITGGTLSLVSLFGLLTVLALGARNAIMLVSEYQRRASQNGEAVSFEMIHNGTRQQVGPILVTGLVTLIMLLPFVVFGNIAGLEIGRPIASIIIVGLLTSTFYNLFIVPRLYLRLGAKREEDLGFHPAVQDIVPGQAGD